MVQVDASSRGLSDVYHPNSAFGSSDRESYNSVTTGAAYADLLLLDNRGNHNGMVITLTETGAAQSFYYQILASIKDGATIPTAGATPDVSYRTLVTNVSVALSGGDYQILAAPWKWVVVQVKNNSGAATVTGRARGV